MDLNKVMLIGRLTANPETRTTAQGVTVATFGLATGRRWKDQQGNLQDRTEFHNIVAWRRLAEICAQYLAKGRQVFIEGHLQTRNWDGQDGKKHYRTEVVADNLIMLGSRPEGSPATATNRPVSASQSVVNPVVNLTDNKTEPAQMEAPSEITDEEIRIEDIPF